MFRKLAFALLILIALQAYSQGRSRSVGSGPADAALAPISVPGPTAAGIVASVTGNLISLAGGLVTIDAAGARITDDHGGAGTIGSVTPGSVIFAILSTTNVAPNAPLPVSMIAVAHTAQVTLSGPVQSVGPNAFVLLGRSIAVDPNTSFGGGIRGLAGMFAGDLAQVQANAAGGVLVATSVLVFPPHPKPPVIIYGTVKGIGADSWIITDRAKKDWTIVINAQTRILGDPRVGDDVEILVNADNANQLVAVSIVKSPSVFGEPLVAFRGAVKMIGPSSWVIHEPHANRDFTIAVDARTKITGEPKINDVVDVTARVDAAGNYTAVSITKEGVVPTVTLRGKVKAIAGLACPAATCTEAVWTIGPEVGLGPDFLIQVNAHTKISGDPKVGDRVAVVAQPSPTGSLALSIVKE